MEMKYSFDKSVVFDSVNHTYFYGEKQLISVTSFISKFKNEFDSDYWSKKIALRDNKTQKEILEQWREKAKKSCEIGTAIHKIFEDYINKNYSFIGDEISFNFLNIHKDYIPEFTLKSKQAIQFIKDFFISGRLIPIHTEYIVYNEILAGQIDLVCKDKKNNFYILDFKTNEKIEINSYGKNLKHSLKNIPDSNFYHYSLQLSIYKQMFNENTKGIFIVHIKPDKYDFIECVDIFKNYNINFKELINETKNNNRN